MKNPFEIHGIPHLSPSTCNTYVGSPASFVLEKCLKQRGQVGCAAFRGTAVEAGIAHGLETGALDDECIRVANEKFYELSAISQDPQKEKERAAVADMVRVGLKELRPYGPPTGAQGKIEYRFEGLLVPFIGYFDFEWQNHKIIVDLKTTHAIPSKIKTNHARQVALYTAAKGHDLDPRLAYVSTKKSAVYRLENVEEHVATLGRIGLTIQKFLSISDDPMELAALVVPDVDSFYFNDPFARQAVFDIWKM